MKRMLVESMKELVSSMATKEGTEISEIKSFIDIDGKMPEDIQMVDSGSDTDDDDVKVQEKTTVPELAMSVLLLQFPSNM